MRFKAACLFFEMRFHPSARLCAQPFLSDDFEAVCGAYCARRLDDLPLFTRIDTVRQQLAGVVSFVSCFLETSLRIGAEAERVPLFRVWAAVVQAPPSGAVGLDEQIEAACIGKFGWLGVGLSTANQGVGQWHTVVNPVDGNRPDMAFVTVKATVDFLRLASDGLGRPGMPGFLKCLISFGK